MSSGRALLVVLVSVLPVCGAKSEDGCEHPFIGSWRGSPQADSIELSSSGSFEYNGPDGCSSTGTFACPTSQMTSGTLRVSIEVSTGGLCLAAGEYTCQFAIEGSAMAYDCGGGAFTYTRQ